LFKIIIFRENIFAIYKALKQLLRLNNILAFTVYKSITLVVFSTFILFIRVIAVLFIKAILQDSKFFIALS
jgi:hypothetical protein